jgi:hypothetical protein
VRRIEHQHNTREQVKGYLETALELVGELEVDGDLKVACFEKAVDLVAGKQIVFEQAGFAGVDLAKIRQG